MRRVYKDIFLSHDTLWLIFETALPHKSPGLAPFGTTYIFTHPLNHLVPPMSLVSSLNDLHLQTTENPDFSDKKSVIANVVGATDADDFPDGGLQAWLVLTGAMCVTFATFGYVNAWGVFQAYYQETLLKDSSTSSIAWIGSIQYALVFFPGIVVGRLFDLGHLKAPLFIASSLVVIATFLTAQCTRYWHFLVCQGLVIGVSSGVCFSPTPAVVSHWFKRRRGVALGLLAVGSSIGGTVFPIMARLLIARVGFQWTMRIIGFVLLVSLGFANLTIKRRLPPVNVTGGLLNLKAFKYPPFTVYCLSGLTIYLGLYTVLTYIDVAATSIGISPDFSFYLVAIANAGSGLGRFVSGYIADSHGPMNAMIPATAIAGVLTYAWPFATDKGSLIAVAVLYGCFSGTYTSLLSKPMIELGDTGDAGRRLGMFLSILAIGALAGPPISGAINSATGGFHVVGYYAGSVILVGVCLLSISRHLVLRQLWGKF